MSPRFAAVLGHDKHLRIEPDPIEWIRPRATSTTADGFIVYEDDTEVVRVSTLAHSVEVFTKDTEIRTVAVDREAVLDVDANGDLILVANHQCSVVSTHTRESTSIMRAMPDGRMITDEAIGHEVRRSVMAADGARVLPMRICSDVWEVSKTAITMAGQRITDFIDGDWVWHISTAQWLDVTAMLRDAFPSNPLSDDGIPQILD